MSEVTHPGLGSRRSMVEQLQLDMRLLGMLGAFALVILVFTVATGGTFLTPRNIFNITIQTVSVAIMATGMVFVIVMRHIDLSVGSLLAMCSAVMAMTQTQWLPQYFGLPLGHWAIAPLAILAGLVTGTAIGALHGWLAGYQGIPSFIVTLGGLLIWRNVAWYTTRGQTIGPLDQTLILFGGAEGILFPTWSWIIGIAATLVALWAIWSTRKRKESHGFPVKPLWAEAVLSALAAGAILGFVAILNAYQLPPGRLRRMFEARGETVPEGYSIGHGLPISVLLLILVVVAMTVIARKTRFGRYIYATGGNPEAAALSGINTRWLTVKVFALMGFLCGLSALVAQARLQNHGNDIGTLDELRVIAAAVIGGTALAGGVGTIYGAILGALIMQSLQSGMGMVGVDTPFQNIVVGLVLVLAVWIDAAYRKRLGVR
ncbi:ABC-type xylose transport system, permease component [Rubellimicrobium thermophilum DSM 16684]|uniref:Xylose transport system permease protein XylH n=1 Tax=Rubellimicrobium thermophilum DSM 16684 TaxID=1123069 RepID=S9S7X1_9RHOB|nr:sugar ABC transporter permease [Rubellimicrobium thermophilum]EPX86280.1 ABC-type xylose transport system, permease component [Rubellimicrobium thermophilum DSM 16684]